MHVLISHLAHIIVCTLKMLESAVEVSYEDTFVCMCVCTCYMCVIMCLRAWGEGGWGLVTLPDL